MVTTIVVAMLGSNTETAVKAFQIAQKLTQNGKIDKSTIAKMKSYKK